MVRILTICVLVWVAFYAEHAGAQPVQEQVITQLKQQGYNSIRVSRTLLGRTRIIANSDESRREIVINPRTGEILRDFWKLKEETADDERENRIFSSGGKNSGNGNGSTNSGKGSSGGGGNSGQGGGGHDDDDDDDDDDDNSGSGRDDDDDDDHDNSGSGSDNSGSGRNDDDDDDDDDDNDDH